MAEYKSLFVCGKCGDDQSNRKLASERDLQKVILDGYANMLCRKCRLMLEDEIEDLACRYLGQ